MSSITITLSDQEYSDVVAAICERFDYQPTVNGAANPETDYTFANRQIARILKDMIAEKRSKTIVTVIDGQQAILVAKYEADRKMALDSVATTLASATITVTATPPATVLRRP